MANPSAKGNPASGGTRPASQQKGATGGAAGQTVTNPRAESGRFVPTDTAKKVLEHFGGDPNKALEGYASLEQAHTKTNQQLQRMQSQLESLQGLSDFVEQDPITGKVRLKKEFQEDVAAGGTKAADARKAFEQQLEQRLGKIPKDGNPSAAIIETMWEVAQAVAQQAVSAVRNEVGGLNTNNQLSLFLINNPEYMPLGMHIKNWIAKQPTDVQKSITLDEAAIIVKGRLAKTGQLEATGYKEPSDEEIAETRNRTSLSGGSSAGPSGTEGKTDEEIDAEIKNGIKNAPGGYDAFLAKSRTRSLGKVPEEAA